MIIDQSIEIQVPLSTAYNQWTQFESFPRFMTTVKNVKQIRPHLNRWVVGIGPARHEFHAEIVEQEPDSHVIWQSLDPRSSPHRGSVRFEPAGSERTVMTLRMEIKPRGASGLLVSAPGVVDKAVRSELGHFREFIESLGHEGGAWRGVIRDGHVRPVEPEPPRSQVPHWPVG